MSTSKRGGSGDRGTFDAPLKGAVERLIRSVTPTSEGLCGALDLVNTPGRVAKMYEEEVLSSYRPGAEEALVKSFTTFPSVSDDMIVIGPTPFASTCAHHMLPFVGDAWVGYIPNSHIVGLSKVARVVDFYARMLQVQERMTSQVADFIATRLEARAVVVQVHARHMCMEIRGVRKPGVVTKTSALRGLAFSDAGVRSEFYALMK